MENPFVIGRYYNRQADIHGQYGGNKQSGISASAQAPFVFLFTGGTGKAHGYHDGWDGDVFRYYGEGQSGDMTLTKGNKALLEHSLRGKTLLLFQSHGKGQPVSYVGEFVCAGHEWIADKDGAGQNRQAVIFHLTRSNVDGDDICPTTLIEKPLKALRVQAYAAAKISDPKVREIQIRKRCSIIKAYALKRANGKCECCGLEAPFLTKHGVPYLEVHHIKKLSDYGLDSPDNVAALTPNCHRNIHQGADGHERDEKLSRIIKEKESESN